MYASSFITYPLVKLKGMMGNKKHEVVTTWRRVSRVHNTKFYCFRARLHCYYCLYNIFSANTVRRSKALRGDPEKYPANPR